MQFMARYTIPMDKSRNLIAFIKMSKSMKITLIENLYMWLGHVDGDVDEAFQVMTPKTTEEYKNMKSIPHFLFWYNLIFI
jgi:hypothetical protein